MSFCTRLSPLLLRFVMSLSIVVTLSVVFTATGARADTQCFDIFKRTALDIRMEANDEYDLQLGLVHGTPRLRTATIRNLFRNAQDIFDSNGVEYQILSKPQRILIKPSDKTPLNRFATEIQKAYAAPVVFDAASLINEGGYANIWFKNYEKPEPLEKELNISWATVKLSGLGGFYRDTIILHELRHLRTLKLLAEKKPSPFFGALWLVEGTIPDDPNASVGEYNGFMSYDEIKAYHTMVKEELTLLRGFYRRQVSPQLIGNQINTVLTDLNRLSIVLSRTISSLAPIFGEYPGTLSGDKTLFNGIVTYNLYVDHGPVGVYRMDFPLVRSQGLDDPENFNYLVAQVSWLSTVAKNMNAQLIEATQIVNTLYPTTDPTVAVPKIDAAQNELGSSDVVPPEPTGVEDEEF